MGWFNMVQPMMAIELVNDGKHGGNCGAPVEIGESVAAEGDIVMPSNVIALVRGFGPVWGCYRSVAVKSGQLIATKVPADSKLLGFSGTIPFSRIL